MNKCCAFALMMLLAFVSIARAGGPLDTRVPADALVYVGWQGADDLARDYEQSNLKGILDNSKVRDYLVENWPIWLGKARENDAEVADRIDQAMVGLNLLWRHTTALYVGPMGFADPKKPTFKAAIVCEAGVDAAALEDWAKKLIAKYPPPPEAKLAVFRMQTLVVLTVGEAKPEEFAGANGGLAAAPAYKAATASLMKDRPVAFYLDAQKIIATIQDGVQKSPDAPAELKTKLPLIIKAVGLNGLSQIAYGGAMDGKEWREQAFVGAKAPRTGILALLDAQPISDNALKLVPKDAAAFNAGRADLSKIMPIVRDVMKQAFPENMKDFDDAIAKANKFVGVDLEKDLINTFGDEWVSYRGPLSETNSHPFVLVQKLKDGPTLSKSIDALTAKFNAMAGGRMQIETLDAGTMEVTGIRLPQQTVAWTIRDGYLYVSTLEGITAAVEQVEKKGESILANPQYVKIRESFPANKWVSITYADPAKLYPELYRTMMGLLPLAAMAGVNLPEGLLPNPKRVAQFMPPGGSVSWVEADGLHMIAHSAFPGAAILSGQPSTTDAVAVTTVGTAAMLPALARARMQARTVRTLANLHQIAIASFTYAGDNKDMFPDHLAQLLTNGDLQDAKVFVSPKAGTKPLDVTKEKLEKAKTDFDAFAKEFDSHCDFVYLGKGLKSRDSQPNEIMCYEKATLNAKGICALFYDGHCEWVAINVLPQMFKTTNASLKARDLPEVDVAAMLKTARGEK